MYLKSVTLRNFKALQNLDIDFSEGLNVIFGLNEAGKSTFLEALTAAFFINADSGSRDVLKFRPWGTVADPYVEVKFVAAGNEYRLEKEFLGSRRGRLSCPAIRLDFTNKDKINEGLAEILPLGVISSDSHKRTFWIAQRELEDTIESLHGDSDIRTALQSAIMKADGDIEAIKTSVDLKIRDISKGTQRHAITPGPLEQSRQALERADGEFKEIKAKFLSLEQDVAKQKSLTEKVASLEKKIKEDEDILLAAENYSRARMKVDLSNNSLDALQEELDAYQRNQARLEELHSWASELDSVQRGAESIIKSLHALEEVHHIQSKLREEEELLSQTARLDQQIAETQSKLTSIEQIPKVDIDLARNLEKAIAAKQEALKASQLSVDAKGLSVVELMISEDQFPDRPERLDKGEERTFRANQRVKVTVPGFIELSVSSGVNSAVDLQSDLAVAEKSCASLLSQYSVASIDELAAHFDSQQKLASELTGLEKEKAGVLRGRTVDNVKASIEELQSQKKEKSIPGEKYELKEGETIETYRVKKEQSAVERGKIDTEASQIELAVKKFAQTFSSIDAALAKKRELAREAAKAEAALDEMPKMELADDQAFLRKQQLGRNRTEHETARNELLRLSGALQASPVSSDQLSLKEAELEEATATYRMHLLEYEAYLLLQETLAEAEAEVTKHLTDPIQKLAMTILPRLTNGRYASVNLDESLKINTVQFESRNVDPDDLSTGAKGQLALALRLALIEHLSGGERQTVIIDDALVNFDSDRLTEAKRLVEEFAQHQQVIYLTCHEDMTIGNRSANLVRV
jgi:DNA repair protein SbcC/Rad50